MKCLISAVLLLMFSSFFVPDTSEKLCNKRWLLFATGEGGANVSDIAVKPAEKSKLYEYHFSSDAVFTETMLATGYTIKQRWKLSNLVNHIQICFIPLEWDAKSKSKIEIYPCNTFIKKLTPDTLIIGEYNRSLQRNFYQYLVRLK